MVVIRFSMREGIDALVDGTKTTTIRRNPDRWLDLYNRGLDLDIHYAQEPPWKGGKSHRVGERAFAFLRFANGDALTQADADRDGFKTKDELIDALARLHGYTRQAVLETKWAIIHFGEWKDGPHWPEGTR
jgi:hypothetical protein